jgi:mono/diheme cytochrome c family protein
MMRGLLTAGFAVSAMAFAMTVSAADAAKGKQVYAGATPKCAMCHSIGGAGNAKGPLDAVGGKLTAADIKAWIRTPKEMAVKNKAERKPAMLVYGPEKISDADLDDLAAYLGTLK